MTSCNSGASISPNQNDASVKASLGKIKNKLLVMSGKGGVGKTSVSVNLSIALANKGFKVGIMDVDIHGPDVPRMLGLNGMLEISEERKLKPMRYNDNLVAVSIESLMPDKDDAIIWRGPMKYNVINQFMGDVDWGELDYLIIDSPPGTGDEPLTIAQKIPDAKAVIVTTPQEISLADVRKSINFCRILKMNIAGLIENMSGYVCPRCGEILKLFGSGGGERTAKDAAIPFLGSIPFDPNVVVCGDSGTSFQEKYASSPATQMFSDIAEKLTQTGTSESHEIKRSNHFMKFAIPLANGKLTAHFGHCQEFALIDVEQNEIKNKKLVVPPPHEPGVLPKWLSEQGTNVVIAGGIGHRAISLFDQAGIRVITGAPVETPEALVLSYLNNTLVNGENLCAGDHHGTGDHQCGH